MVVVGSEGVFLDWLFRENIRMGKEWGRIKFER